MTFVVTDDCINCKYKDCIEVCPVDCFYEGDTIANADFWVELNKKYSENWVNVTEKGEPCADREKWANKPDKLKLMSEKSAA